MTRASRHAAEAVWDPVVPPAPSIIDLHTHTRRSDGVLEPAELVSQAAAAGIRLLAVTDHDNLAGYREAARGSVPAGVELIPGVEINAVASGTRKFWEGELHVLGLGMDPDDDAFEQALVIQREQRRRRFAAILQRLRDLDMPIDDAIEAMHLVDDDALGRPTLARALIAKGYADTVEDAFRRWIGHGMPAWVPRGGLGPREAIAAIRAAGGLPVLAHFGEAPDRVSTIRDLMAVGLAGLEVYYRNWDRHIVAAVESVARDLGLLMTGGSDYHGDFGPYAESHASLWVPPEVGVALRRELAVTRPGPPPAASSRPAGAPGPPAARSVD